MVSAYGFAAWQSGISRAGANEVLVYQYLMTLVGVVASMLLLGESLGMAGLLGTVVVLLGVHVARNH